jgi:proteasome accessory factor B
VSKVERLMNLTMALLGTPRPLTAAELRQRIPGYPPAEPSFRRAFERDKDALREMGIPLRRVVVPYSDPPVEGYQINEDEYYLRDPGFEPDELAALHLAVSAARLDASQGREALWKLGGIVAGADDLEPTDPPVDTLVELPNDTHLVPLFGAATDRRQVRLTYRGIDRHVDPYRLDFRRGRWYLTGFDHTRGEIRNFRLDRIEGDVEPGKPGSFERPPAAPGAGRPAEPWQFQDEAPVTARLLVDADQAAILARHLHIDDPDRPGETPGATIETQPDGSVVAEVIVTNWPAFRSFLLTFLEHAELLGPPALRADLVTWLDHVANPPPPPGEVPAGTDTASLAP